jgi:hypothetical protein
VEVAEPVIERGDRAAPVRQRVVERADLAVCHERLEMLPEAVARDVDLAAAGADPVVAQIVMSLRRRRAPAPSGSAATFTPTRTRDPTDLMPALRAPYGPPRDGHRRTHPRPGSSRRRRPDGPAQEPVDLAGIVRTSTTPEPRWRRPAARRPAVLLVGEVVGSEELDDRHAPVEELPAPARSPGSRSGAPRRSRDPIVRASRRVLRSSAAPGAGAASMRRGRSASRRYRAEPSLGGLRALALSPRSKSRGEVARSSTASTSSSSAPATSAHCPSKHEPDSTTRSTPCPASDRPRRRRPP